MNNPSCIDLLLTNIRCSFQHTSVMSSGLSDFHELVLTVMKTIFPKAKPNEIFNETIFNDDLKRYLYANTESSRNFSKFQEILLNVLDIHTCSYEKEIY